MVILVFVRCQGDFGPFRPNIASEVPLWLAVALKERGKCDIRAPDWMSVGESLFLCCCSNSCFHEVWRLNIKSYYFKLSHWSFSVYWIRHYVMLLNQDPEWRCVHLHAWSVCMTHWDVIGHVLAAWHHISWFCGSFMLVNKIVLECGCP